MFKRISYPSLPTVHPNTCNFPTITREIHEIVPMNLSKSLNTCASFSNIFDHHIYVLELNGIQLCDTRIYNLSSTHMQTRTHDSRIDIYWSVVIPPFRIDRDTKSAWFPTIRIVEINRGTINSWCTSRFVITLINLVAGYEIQVNEGTKVFLIAKGGKGGEMERKETRI